MYCNSIKESMFYWSTLRLNLFILSIKYVSKSKHIHIWIKFTVIEIK